MYRSLLTLDLLNPSIQQALRNCNDMHRNLMKAFSFSDGSTPRADASILYNVINIANKPALYVLSKEMPNWKAVSGVCNFEDSPPLCLDELKNKLVAGNRYKFRLFASPTKKVARDGKLSARVFIKNADDRERWLLKSAAANGFKVLNYTEKGQEQISGKKKDNEIHFTGVTFIGYMEITDPDLFWNAYCNGIGPGKSYGLGLIMISR